MARATRNDECTINRSETSHVLYLAFELGVDEWKLGFTKDLGTKPRVRVMPARDLKRLAREIAAAKQWFALSEITPVRDSGDRQPGGRLVEQRGESTPAACEVRRVGR